MTDTPGVQRSILYIEDNPATVRLVERLLASVDTQNRPYVDT